MLKTERGSVITKSKVSKLKTSTSRKHRIVMQMRLKKKHSIFKANEQILNILRSDAVDV